jgi:hypothetical protein
MKINSGHKRFLTANVGWRQRSNDASFPPENAE